MAQRFAIDGNFTQSFVGTVSLDAQACPSNNSSDFASLYYDIDTKAVCYITSSTDFCYEFIFNDSSTVGINKTDPGTKANPPAGSFQFVGTSGGDAPVGSLNAPKTSLTSTKFLLINSASSNAGGLLGYLIQNTQSGSIKLSTTTQVVQINYTTQNTTGSLDNNLVIIGSSNENPAFASSSFTILTQTSNTPFTNGERVCIEVSSQGGGGLSTLQQTLEAGNSASLGITSSFLKTTKVSFIGNSSIPIRLTPHSTYDYVVISGSGLVIQPVVGAEPTSVEGGVIYSSSNFYAGIEL